MNVEMRRPHRDAVAQHAARFGIGLGCLELEFRAVEFIGNLGRITEAPMQAINPCNSGGTTLQKTAAGPQRPAGTQLTHTALSPLKLALSAPKSGEGNKRSPAPCGARLTPCRATPCPIGRHRR